MNGSTEKLIWTFDSPISTVTYREWHFTSSNGSGTTLARILDNIDPLLSKPSLILFAVEKPGTLVLKNITISYNGTYKFTVVANGRGSASEVTVFIAGKF